MEKEKQNNCAICGELVETFGLESVAQDLCWSCRREQESND